ncbi:hypothetical protein DTW90_29095 [Neorhizobium sp. P12A]|uniref:hypothetical protein n=1 Tax=Rhizobium/Agrobacterium group TaxID=227290 RepID=UPI0010529E8F|nr:MULTISPECIES: hypothetical protein [Rhizobium/Agrobacterium group]KAA0690950.1 hypothetical protein DTW90_29095 [Neorhizobium sp. P12A]TCR87662.1 hypothetical protein EV561_1057 [Rhizobium sp. BK376]
MSKITNGPNDRPRDESIAQSGPGIPDDSSAPVTASDKEIEEARRKLRSGYRPSESVELERQLERPKHGTA